MMLVTSALHYGSKHTPGPGVTEAEEHLAGARVDAVWLLSHVDKINQQVSSSAGELCGALPWPSEHKHVELPAAPLCFPSLA